MAAKISKSLCFAWVGDFNMLKNFVQDKLKLTGLWSQPGGDKKVFTAEDLTIIWRKNKNLLSFDGEKANHITKELCKQMCKFDEFGLETPTFKDEQPSMQSSEVHEAFESLKLGQTVNCEAIQAISGTISHLTSVIAEFQGFMDKNKKDLRHNYETRVEQINITDESFEYVSKERNRTPNKAKSDITCGSNVIINSTENNGITSNNVNNGGNSDHNLMSAEQTPMNKGHQSTYADVAASPPVLTEK